MMDWHQGRLSEAGRAAQWRPKSDCIDLWLVQWSLAELWREIPPNAKAHWTPAQHQRWSKISEPVAKQRYAWTQLWMAQVLARYLPNAAGPAKIQKDPKGRPYLEGARASLSLSHCEDLVLLCVDPQGAAIGVDLEPMDSQRAMQGIVSRFFGERSQARFAHLPHQERCSVFYWWWTAKEAVAKASGEGLSTELLSVDLPVLAGSGVEFDWRGARYWIESLGWWKGRQGSLCRELRRDSAPLRSFWLSQQELA